MIEENKYSNFTLIHNCVHNLLKQCAQDKKQISGNENNKICAHTYDIYKYNIYTSFVSATLASFQWFLVAHIAVGNSRTWNG